MTTLTMVVLVVGGGIIAALFRIAAALHDAAQSADLARTLNRGSERLEQEVRAQKK